MSTYEQSAWPVRRDAREPSVQLVPASAAPSPVERAQDGESAWLFDAYVHPKKSGIVVWIKRGRHVGKRFIPWTPEFCIRSEQDPLERAQRLLRSDPRVATIRRDKAILWLRGPEQEVLRVAPKRIQDTWALATDLRKRTQTKGYLFYDVDHGQESRWMHSQGLWSMCQLHISPRGVELRPAQAEKGRWDLDYPNPDLRTLRLEVVARQRGNVPSFDDPLEAIHLVADSTQTLACAAPGNEEAERHTLRSLGAALARLDPDVILTRHGDRFDIPFLLHRIKRLGLRDEVRLGRDVDPEPDHPDQASKSIHTYGRWLFKTHAYYLRGRWHIDLAKKTLDSEDDRKDVHGIVYLSRVSNRRAQDVNRNGAGFALQQMQIDLATDWGVALPWKRNLAEDWKSAATLCAVDRGGQIMVPEPGLYSDIAACDFSGYYPSLVVRHNLSSDAMNCTCCPDGEMVPELGYHVCRTPGHQSTILKRLEPHRRWAKGLIKKAASLPGEVPSDLLAKAKAVKSEHKALGVVCFGYFRYRNARFGCAEVHQAIQCYGRAGMTRAREVAHAHGFTMVHTLTDCVFLHKPGLTRSDATGIATRIKDEVGVPMDVEGLYRWLVLLPSKTHSKQLSDVGVPNRYYGKFEDGNLKVRGIEVQRHSTPPFLYDVQQAMLDVLAEADDPDGFLRRIPRALHVAKEGALRLRRRQVAVQDLGLMVQARMAVEDYVATTGTRSALRQLRDAGTERRPGEYVKYVVQRADGPRDARARPVELLGTASRWFGAAPETYHVEAYVRLLARSVETLLTPFGYHEDGLHEWLMGRSPRPATRVRRGATPEVVARATLRT